MKVAKLANDEGLSISRGKLQIEKRYTGPKRTITWYDDDRCPVRPIEVVAIQGDQRLKLHELLPKEWELLELQFSFQRMNVQCDTANEQVLVPRSLVPHSMKNPTQVRDFFAERFSLSALLHDIGHALQKRIWNKEDLNQVDALYFLMQMGGATCAEAHVKYILAHEMDASLFSRLCIEHYRESGIDLEPESSIDEIIKHQFRALQSHIPDVLREDIAAYCKT